MSGADILRLLCKHNMAGNSTAFLCQASHIQHGTTLTCEMGSHTQYRTDSYDTRSPYPCQQDTVMPANRCHFGFE